MLKLVNLLLLTASTIVLCYYSPRNIRLRTVQSRVYSSVFNRFQEAFRPKQKKKYMSESEKLVEYVDYKPWRATKVKHLNIHYKPWKDSWQERYRVENEDTIYLYSIDESRTLLSSTRVDDAWMWPWMWSKHKAERLAWIYKLFIEDVDSVTVQEHMEMDNFFSEFDMPTRWGLVRLKELDVLNVAALWLAFWTDFNGVKPTDLGLRPDGTVRTCPVQFHNCLSSSNSPLDTDHYAPPLRWDRAKSPDQAFEEIKSVYFNYPKRGLRWTYGWIDRGGWKPQQFSSNYFYAQADSMAWHYTDDIELKLDFEKREVLYRSSTRLGQTDWDVERLRYTQFVRMLEKKGGWNNEPMPRLNYLARTPYRWTQLALDKSFSSLEKALDSLVVTASTTGDSGNGDSVGAFRSLINELKQDLAPYVRPIITTFEDLKETVRLDPRVAGVIQLVNDLEEQVNTMENSATSSVKESITDIIDRLSLLIPELPGPSSDDFAIPKESQIDQESSPVESINELDDNSNSTPDQGALPSVDEEVYSSGDDEVTRFLKLKHSVPVSKAFEDVKVEAGKPSLFSIDSVPSKTPPVDDASTIVSAVGEKPWLKKRVAPVHSVESAVEVSDNTDMDNFETRKLQRIQRYKQWQPADIDIDVADVTTNDERIRGRRAMKLSNVEREMANRKVAELKRSYRTLGQRV